MLSSFQGRPHFSFQWHKNYWVKKNVQIGQWFYLAYSPYYVYLKYVWVYVCIHTDFSLLLESGKVSCLNCYESWSGITCPLRRVLKNTRRYVPTSTGDFQTSHSNNGTGVLQLSWACCWNCWPVLKFMKLFSPMKSCQGVKQNETKYISLEFK